MRKAPRQSGERKTEQAPHVRVVIGANTAWNLWNFRSGLIRALAEAGIDVIAVAPADKYVPRLVGLGCRFVDMPMDGMGTSPIEDTRLLVRFWRLFRELRPHFFLGYTIKPNIYGSIAARLCGVRTINNISGLGNAFLSEGWLNRVVRILYAQSLRRSDHVFFQNPDDQALFVDLGLAKSERSSLLPGSGVDLARFSPLAPSQGESVSFLLIARLIWDKGIGEYVEAARIVTRQFPHARFLLLGLFAPDNPSAIDKQTLDGWIAEGVVDYIGRLDDVRPVIADADCVVLPSYYPEGTPRTLLEGAAMGKPLITTDLPGCREVVDHGVNGYLCQPRDPGDLASKIGEFLQLTEESRAAMRLASRQKAEQQFDESIIIRAYLQRLGR